MVRKPPLEDTDAPSVRGGMGIVGGMGIMGIIWIKKKVDNSSLSPLYKELYMVKNYGYVYIGLDRDVDTMDKKQPDIYKPKGLEKGLKGITI